MFYKTHMFTFLMWQIWKLYNSADGHSGYNFPIQPFRIIPFVIESRYHDFHHTKNIGNYATNFYLFELFSNANKIFFDR